MVGLGKEAIQAKLTKLRKITVAVLHMRQRGNCMCVTAVHMGVLYQELDLVGWQENIQM